MTELSERSGVARSTISNWDTNRRKPYAKAVNAVADALGIDRAEAHVLAGIVAPEPGSGPEPVIPPELLAAVPPELVQAVKLHAPKNEWIDVLSAIAGAMNPTAPAASADRSEAPRRAG